MQLAVGTDVSVLREDSVLTDDCCRYEPVPGLIARIEPDQRGQQDGQLLEASDD